MFAMIAFCVLAIAGVALDVGTAWLTQRQMQTAAQTEALEGLRFRDDFPQAWLTQNSDLQAAITSDTGPPPSTTQTPTDPTWQQWRDGARRVVASRQAQLLFDDDLDLTDGDSQNFGAGPIVSLSGGSGPPAYGYQTLSIPTPPVYKPQPQLNTSNVQGGDLVAGQYGDNSTYSGATGSDESGDYSRPDFQPTPASSAGQNGPANNALLARLRRSNEDLSGSAGVASGGPTLPYLFAEGSLLSPITRSQGITVRAAAVAAAGSVTLGGATVEVGRAKSVGQPHLDATVRMPGLAPFALSATYWGKTGAVPTVWSTNGSDTAIVNPATGTITAPSLSGTPIVGMVGPATPSSLGLLSIGQTYTAGTSDAGLTSVSATDASLYAYVPIYDTLADGTTLLVGFGYVQWSYAAPSLTITRAFQNSQLYEPIVGSGNVSAALVQALPTTLSATDVQAMLTSHSALFQPLRAPALVDHHLPAGG